jgi:hypothetical protein
MAVGIRLKFAGGTQENYDTAHGVMEIDMNPPDGMIVHSARSGGRGLGCDRLLGVAGEVRRVRPGAAYAALARARRPGIPVPSRCPTETR